MNAKLVFVLFVASALALVESDLVTVKGRKYKPFDTPKYCITRYNPFKEKPEYYDPRRFNVYDQLLKCNEDSACLGIVIGGNAGTMAVGKTRGTTTGGDDRGYLKIAGDTCPEGAVPYEPPEDVYSKNFCQHENRSCEAERMTDGPIKTKNADYCMKKCIALPECTGINYLENKKITKRCELLQGYCRGREMRGFYGMTHYRRLDHLRGADCSNEPVFAPYCAAGDVEVVSDTFQESGSRDPTAQCPDQHVVTHCECSVGLRDSECGGTRINRDMTTCTAKRHYKGRYIRARACCRPMKENIVPYYHSTYRYDLTCPTNTVAHCVANDDKRAIEPSEDISMTSTSDPRTCRLPHKWTASMTEIQAVCLATYKMEVFDERECIEQEHAVEGGSEAACEEGWYVSHCLCEGDQCTGTSTTSDASTCTAHGQAGAVVKARACCTKLGDGEEVGVASEPEHGTSRAPYADCPYGGSTVVCLITSTSGSRVYADGSRCWTPYSCLGCRVQIICTRQLPPPRPFECADGERELLGGEKDISNDPRRHSSVQCGLDEYMTRCDCEEAEGECYNVGIETIDLQPGVYPKTKYAFACSVYGGKRNAQACCRKREEGVKYNVQSAPESMSFVHYVRPWNRYSTKVRGGEGPSASCWFGYQVLYCNLYKTPHDAFVGEEPIIEGNRCYASGFCANCAIDVVCRPKKFEPSVPTKAPEDEECGPYETEVFGEIADRGSMSEAACPEGRYVARCDAVKVETEYFCGTSVTKDGMTCRAMPLIDSRQKAKARACCKKLKTNEAVYVVSDPDRMYELWRYPPRYIRSAYGRSSFIECPEKTELVTCMVDGGNYGGGPTMQREGNGCSATGGVMAVCKGGKKWIEKVKG